MKDGELRMSCNEAAIAGLTERMTRMEKIVQHVLIENQALRRENEALRMQSGDRYGLTDLGREILREMNEGEEWKGSDE